MIQGVLDVDKDIRLRWKMPEKPQCFFGRDKELEELSTILDTGNHVVFLQGIGGIGKSEIAKMYAIQNREKYDVIVYCQYTTDLRAMISSDVEVPIENLKRNTLDEYFLESEEEYFVRKFSALKEIVTENTLFLIDNFNNQEEPFLEEFLALNCQMIFMTRYDWSVKRYPVINVVEISRLQDLKKIFYSYYVPENKEEEQAIEEIIKMFCGYTLSIEWVAKQLAEKEVSPQQMLESLREKHTQMESRDFKEGAFFEKLVDIFGVQALSEKEKEVLRYLCFVPKSGISKEELVRRGKPGSHSAVFSLLRNSWIRQIELDVVTLHPVVAEVIEMKLKPDWDNCKVFIKSVENDLLDDELPIEQLDFSLSIAENIFRMLGVEQPEAADLMIATSHAFWKRYKKHKIAMGMLEKAEVLQGKKTEDIRTKIALCKKQDMIDVEYNDLKNSLLEEERKRCSIIKTMGSIQYDIGCYEQALACYMKLSKSPVVDVYCDIAKIYAKVNECKKAREYVHAGIKMKINKYGEKSPQLIENYLLLARICLQNHDKRAACEWMEQAKDIGENKLPIEEKDVFYSHYALLLKEMGMVKEALVYDQKVFVEQRKRFGEENLKVALAYGAMAVDYYRLGDYVSTLECTLKEISIRRKVRHVKKRLYISVSRILNFIDVNSLDERTKEELRGFMSDFNRMMKENPAEGKEMLRE